MRAYSSPWKLIFTNTSSELNDPVLLLASLCASGFFWRLNVQRQIEVLLPLSLWYWISMCGKYQSVGWFENWLCYICVLHCFHQLEAGRARQPPSSLCDILPKEYSWSFSATHLTAGRSFRLVISHENHDSGCFYVAIFCFLWFCPLERYPFGDSLWNFYAVSVFQMSTDNC